MTKQKLQAQLREEGWNKIYHRPRKAGILKESYTCVNIERFLIGEEKQFLDVTRLLELV